MNMLKFAFFFGLALMGAFVMSIGIAGLVAFYSHIVMIPVFIVTSFGRIFLMVYSLDVATSPF